MKTIHGLIVYLLLILFWPITTQAEQALLDDLLSKHPFVFTDCEAALGRKGQCEAPADLSHLTLTSDINIEVILDSSGSMAGTINGKSKASIAKDSLQAFANALPGHVNLALRAYGHIGSNSESDKPLSCMGSDQTYPFQKLDVGSFMDKVNAMTPTGWTPLALSLQRALEDFNRYDSKLNNNIIYLLTDGKETCGGDPVAAASAIAASHVKAVVNVIGFDVHDEDANGLRQIAHAGGGSYFQASNLQELKEVFLSHTSWREWQNYIRCRSEVARLHIEELQNAQQDLFNCVLDSADRNTAEIEAALNQQSIDSGIKAQTMLDIYAHQQQQIEPYYQAYIDGSAFDKYQKELTAIEAIAEKLATQK